MLNKPFKMFAVAYLDYNDNAMKQSIVFADTSLAAMKKVVYKYGFNVEYDGSDEEFMSAMFDSDIAVSAIEVVIT